MWHRMAFSLSPRRRHLSCVALLALAFGGACAVGGAADAREARTGRDNGPILIGAAWPWEEQSALLYARGLELAVEEINARGGAHGRPLALLRLDDRQSVTDGRLVAQRLSGNPDVVAVIGHLQSYVSIPAAAIYDLAGLVMIAPTSTDPRLTAQGYRRVFRTIFTDREVGRQMAEFAAARGYRTVCIYYTRNGYGRELANAFEERAGEVGLTVLDRRSYDPGTQANERAFEQVAKEWKGREPHALFLAAEATEAARFTVEARRQGLDAPILGGDALGVPELPRVGGAAVEGTVIATAFHPEEGHAEAQRFTSAFRARFGQPPDVTAALAYDAVRVLAAGIERAGSSVPEKVAAALHAMDPVEGVTARFQFSPQGDLVAPRVVKLIVRKGRFEYLE